MRHERYFTSPNPVTADKSVPLLFLAGPVQGAPNYHDAFAETLLSEYSDLAIASPRRTPEDQLRFDADEQVSWEIATRERAYKFGVTGIWFAAQDYSDPTYPPGRAYAQTTRIEFGETIGRYVYDKSLKFTVGFDHDYRGGSEGYVRRLMAAHHLQAADFEEEFLSRLRDQIDSLSR